MAAARLAFVWALVGLPLVYGVTQTLIRVSALFGG
ncbi:MFS transporter small subunit [Arthrobacter echini]